MADQPNQNPDLANVTLPENSLELQSTESPQQPIAEETQPKKVGRPRGPAFKKSQKKKPVQRGLGSSPVGKPDDSSDRPAGKSSKTSSDPLHIGQGKLALSPKDKKKLKEVFSGVFVGITKAGSKLVVKHPLEQANQLFIATSDQADAISKPAISIMERHQIGAGTGDSDAADYFEMGIAFVFGYLMPNLALRDAIKQHLREAQVEPPTASNEATVRTTPAESPLYAATGLPIDGGFPSTGDSR